MPAPVSRAANPANGANTDLRTRRKLQTRRAIREAALRLFAEQGYEATTVAQIAAEAVVGERTFFTHFPSKEDVLFNAAQQQGFVEFEQLVVAAPGRLSDVAAIEHALVMWDRSTDTVTSHRMTQWLVRAAATSTVVLGKRMEYANSIAAAVTRGLARRHGEAQPSIESETTAEVVMRMFFLSVGEWAAAGPDEMPAILHRRLAALGRVLGDPDRLGSEHFRVPTHQGHPGQ
ncbi:MAG: TetR/AcrR family transcriptional regulator [Actinomycetota bacterium]|nr:TetR/AcrR family transcriptional regulator [Actinomycetota bacterium]